MNKTKEIEDMARILEFCAHKDCESCRRNGNYRCSAYNKATDLANAGYGNVKQSVKEFLYKIENLLVKQENRYSRLCASKRTLLNLHKKITELYGSDE